MARRAWGLLAVAAASGCGSQPSVVSEPADPPPIGSTPKGAAALVDPFIGTADSDSPDPVGNGRGGSTFPGASVPFGMLQWSPDTERGWPPGYMYDDDAIVGFSLTHLNGAGCPAFHDVPFFPSLDPPDGTGSSQVRFSHDDERASAGFYQVRLASDIEVALTATQRTGYARFTFPKAPRGYLSIAGAHKSDLIASFGFEADIAGDDLVTGSRTAGFFCGTPTDYTVYFAARFSRKLAGFGSWGTQGVSEGFDHAEGVNGGVFVWFDTSGRQVVEVKVGLSYVSVEGALANLAAESPDWGFEPVHEAAVARWNDQLERIRIEGGSESDRKSFYTALYHVLLQPNVFSDDDGQFPGFDDQLHGAGDHVRYANFSGWDVYRSWIQLVSLLAPAEASDIARSLIDTAAECGALPKWSLANDETGVMVGDPADPTLANAWAFGARDFDPQAALDAALLGANDPGAHCNHYVARPGLADYLRLGYCPIDTTENVWGPSATTLEYAVADFAVAQLAEAAGDSATVSEFLDRGRSWQNVFDPATARMQPRFAADSGGQPAFDTVEPGSDYGFVEGNAEQYTFMVPHDAHALVAALGGDAAAEARLDTLFQELNAGVTRPYFYMGNEPQFGTPWLYPWVGAPEKTQAVVRRIVREAFSTQPGGLPGNEDLGATSSWLVWAMLGLYPAVPGVGGFVVGSPLFPHATIRLAGGAEIVINAQGAAPDAPYVQSLSVDGEPWHSTWLPWQRLENGAVLDFVLGSAPSAWGSERPPNMYP